MVYVVGVAGASGSGKTTLTRTLRDSFDDSALIFLDSYYHDQGHIPLEQRAKINYDVPEALDLKFARAQICALKSENPVTVPTYDFAKHTRSGIEFVEPKKVIIVDGIFALRKELADLYDLTVFLDTPLEECIRRRTERDVVERGRRKEDVEKQLEETVIPGYHAFVLPTRKRAQEIFEWNGDMTKKVLHLSDRIREDW